MTATIVNNNTVLTTINANIMAPDDTGETGSDMTTTDLVLKHNHRYADDRLPYDCLRQVAFFALVWVVGPGYPFYLDHFLG